MEINSELCIETSSYLEFKWHLNQITNDQILYMVPCSVYYWKIRNLRNEIPQGILVDYQKLTKSFLAIFFK